MSLLRTSSLVSVLVLVGCTDGESNGKKKKSGPEDTSVDTAVVDTDTDPGTDETTPNQVGFPWVEYDCSQGVPDPPFDRRLLPGTSSNEDITLDFDGYLLAADWGGNILRFTHDDGQAGVLGSGFGDPTGLDILPDGDLIVADRSEGRLVRWHHEDGTIEVVAANVDWPNGVEVAPDGSVYVTDTTHGAVYWVNLESGEVVLAANNINGADGITFNPEYNLLYVGSINTGDIHTIEVFGPGDHGAVNGWVYGDNQAWDVVDGMQVDRCGNLYVADFTEAVWRIDPETRDVLKVVEEPPGAGWGLIPSMRFGSNIGGWDGLKMYVSTYGEVVEVDLGVPNKPRWPPTWP